MRELRERSLGRTHSWYLERRTPSCSLRRAQADTALTRQDYRPPGTSHADPKATATDGHRNLAAAYATTPATPPKSCPVLGITRP